MKISPEIEIMSDEFARDLGEDLKFAAHDATSVSFFKLLREFAQRVSRSRFMRRWIFSPLGALHGRMGTMSPEWARPTASPSLRGCQIATASLSFLQPVASIGRSHGSLPFGSHATVPKMGR
jgi:hypothetical protein